MFLSSWVMFGFHVNSQQSLKFFHHLPCNLAIGQNMRRRIAKFCEKSAKKAETWKPNQKQGNSNPRVAKCWQSRGWTKSCGKCFVKLRNSLKPPPRLPSIHFCWRPQRFFGVPLYEVNTAWLECEASNNSYSSVTLRDIPGDTVHTPKNHVRGQHHVLRFQGMNAYICRIPTVQATDLPQSVHYWSLLWVYPIPLIWYNLQS